MRDLFDHLGLHYQDISIPHQIRCPFHGADIHASARFFPMQNEGSGSFWCWACNNGGDLLWFTQEWYQLDNVVRACEKVEEEFNLARTQDDDVKEFYRDKHKFDAPRTDELKIEGLLLYFEVNATGRVHDDDPASFDEPWLPALRSKCSDELFPKFLDVELVMWTEFDQLREELPKHPFSYAVSTLEAWAITYQQALKEVVDGRS